MLIHTTAFYYEVFMVTQPLSLFRWRPKQRRMVTDTWKNCMEKEFLVVGKGRNIIFIFDSIGVDPGSKLNKKARIYKPDPTSPPNVQDIVLYVRV